MVLSDIYQYIMENFCYYDNQDRAWRNSVRHNLSLNECFIKAGRAENGKCDSTPLLNGHLTKAYHCTFLLAVVLTDHFNFYNNDMAQRPEVGGYIWEA